VKNLSIHISFYYYFHPPIHPSQVRNLSIGIKAMTTQKECIEKLEVDVWEIKTTMQNLQHTLKNSITQTLKKALESISNSHDDSSCHIEKETKELSSLQQILVQIPSPKSTPLAQPPKLSNTSCTTRATPTIIGS
jgi:predicted NAD/FAD-dependent oxidoreductase